MLAFFLLFAFLLEFVAANGSTARRAIPDTGRLLHAAKPKLGKRATRVTEHYDFQFHYAEFSSVESVRPGTNCMSASMKIKNKYPTIILEDFDHLLYQVHCDYGTIELEFSSADAVNEFRNAAEKFGFYRLITSHTTCNDDGGRMPWNITSTYYNKNTVTLEGRALGWDSYKYTLAFGKPLEELEKIPQTRLQRRQNAAETVTPTSTSPPTTTSEAGEEISSFSFAKSVVNHQILPPTGNSTSAKLLGQVIPKGLGLKCKNCTLQGDIDLLSGSIEISSNIIKAIEEIDNLTDSFFEVVANNVFAHIELESTWKGASIGAPIPSIQIPFLEVTISGIQIPHIAKIGIFFDATINFGASVQGDLQFDYGFQIKIPDNSTAMVNLGNVTQSGVTGFGDTEFKLLPFDFKSENLTLTLSAALQPQLNLALEIGASKFSGKVDAGIFLDVPKYSIDISPRKGAIDENCTEIRDREPTQAENILASLGNITHLSPSYEIGAGFQLVLQEFVANASTYSYYPLSTTFAAPTACLAHIEGTGLVAATDLAVSISSDLARASSESAALASAFATANGSNNFGTLPTPTGSKSSANSWIRGNTHEDAFGFQFMLLALSVAVGSIVMVL
ncbi:hypothetical protein TWF694_005261 [Orbilia ellipsospora]|uniref:Uncharacterized protein n=1 Tax=Orbilia ellipsospora TaxID=2528407 RepID=A0AAV9WYN5_9PEZI